MAKQITSSGEQFFYFQAEGNDFQIGQQIGIATKDDIADMWENFMRSRMPDLFGTPVEKHSETYWWLRDNLEKICPWMAKQLDGISCGSGVDAEKIWLMNHYSMLWSANGLFCTSMAVKDSDKGPVLIQNLDIGNENLYFVTKLKFKNDVTVLSDAMCGMCWSPTGINDKGLAVGSSNLGSPNLKPEKPVGCGITNTFLPRMVLRKCSTTQQAIELLQSLPDISPLNSGYQLNIIDCKANMAVVDKTGPHFKVSQCESNMNFTTNYSLNEEIESWRLRKADDNASYNSRMRAKNIQDWHFSLNGGRPSVSSMKKLFKGHKGDGRLCRHGDKTSGGGYSRLHLVYYPVLNKIEITNGLPCENQYQTFTI